MALDELVILTSDQSCTDAISAPNHVFTCTECCNVAAVFYISLHCRKMICQTDITHLKNLTFVKLQRCLESK